MVIFWVRLYCGTLYWPLASYYWQPSLYSCKEIEQGKFPVCDLYNKTRLLISVLALQLLQKQAQVQDKIKADVLLRVPK
jgi:hypothetical protein